jgi:hypothetical protein
MKKIFQNINIKVTISVISSILFFTCSPLDKIAFAADADGTYGVVGRVLYPSATGDIAPWVEIARNGDSSLIVRSTYIRYFPTESPDPIYNTPLFNYGVYANIYAAIHNNSYMDSRVRKVINSWFADAVIVSGKDTSGKVHETRSREQLPKDAILRKFTLKNHAVTNLGGSCYPNALLSGLSYPKPGEFSGAFNSTATDVAFALSYSEVGNFCSIGTFMYGRLPAIQPSPELAQKNYSKITIPGDYGYGMWLRSVGTEEEYAAVLTGPFYFTTGGIAFQHTVMLTNSERGLIYPALWVYGDIFLKAELIYDSNFAPNETVTKKFYIEESDTHTIEKHFSRPVYIFTGWSMLPGYSEIKHLINEKIQVSGNVRLYAQWAKIK